MTYDQDYYDKVWEKAIGLLPTGGLLRYDLRQFCYDLIKEEIPEGSKVFDYACGLGLMVQQIEEEKNCKVSGCDFSKIAIDYVKSKTRGKFRTTDVIFGDRYDVITAIYFLEHTQEPVKWLEMCFKKTDTVLAAIPNNFIRHGEHVHMQWASWDQFNKLFKDFKMRRVDLDDKGKRRYPAMGQFMHPIIEFKQ